MSLRRSYKIKKILLNNINISEVIIDSHYEEKHLRYMNDELILALVQELDGRRELPDSIQGPYSYYATMVEYNRKQYRLIWLLENNAIYIGIVNAYRDKRRS
jgi:hypothetical protein